MRREARRARREQEAVAFEFRSAFFKTPMLTVLTSNRDEAMGMVYALGHTTGDIWAGTLDLVKITRAEARTLGRRK